MKKTLLAVAILSVFTLSGCERKDVNIEKVAAEQQAQAEQVQAPQATQMEQGQPQDTMPSAPPKGDMPPPPPKGGEPRPHPHVPDVEIAPQEQAPQMENAVAEVKQDATTDNATKEVQREFIMINKVSEELQANFDVFRSKFTDLQSNKLSEDEVKQLVMGLNEYSDKASEAFNSVEVRTEPVRVYREKMLNNLDLTKSVLTDTIKMMLNHETMTQDELSAFAAQLNEKSATLSKNTDDMVETRNQIIKEYHIKW